MDPVSILMAAMALVGYTMTTVLAVVTGAVDLTHTTENTMRDLRILGTILLHEVGEGLSQAGESIRVATRRSFTSMKEWLSGAFLTLLFLSRTGYAYLRRLTLEDMAPLEISLDQLW